MIRLYGHMKGSFQTVTLGLELAFKELGVHEGTYYGENVEFEDGIGGANAPVAVVTGDPMRVLMAHYHGRHQEVWLMLAPNSEGIPPVIKGELQGELLLNGERRSTITGLLAPSTWAEGVLRREFPNHPVMLCQHGVLSVFKMDSERRERAAQLFDDGIFRALHVTSSRLSRKGTKELVEAWKRVHPEYPSSELDVLVNPEFLSEFLDFVSQVGAEHCVRIVPGQNNTWRGYSKGIQDYAFMVQPSRAEGFGLVPLEAGACGIPVVMTPWTGHADHYNRPGVCVVQGDAVLEESDDYLGAKAPGIDVEAVYQSLSIMLKSWREHNGWAAEVSSGISTQWTWSGRAVQAVEQLKKRVSTHE